MFIFAAAHIDIHTLQLSNHNPAPAVQHSVKKYPGFKRIKAHECENGVKTKSKAEQKYINSNLGLF